MDFEKKTIEVRYFSTDFGPHVFDFEKGIPEGLTLSSVTVRSWLGQFEPDDDLTAALESTDDLIDAAKTAVSGDYGVAVYFNYPGASWAGKHTLVFQITLSNDADHPYYFYCVLVKGGTAE